MNTPRVTADHWAVDRPAPSENAQAAWKDRAGLPIPPTSHGPYAAAWRRGAANHSHASPIIADWIVWAPTAHPFWSGYWMVLSHLRPIDGLPNATLYRPGRTHEFTVYALNPSVPLKLEGKVAVLNPVNITGQFRQHTDEDAIDYATNLIRFVTKGNLSPDTDFRRSWGSLLTLAPGMS